MNLVLNCESGGYLKLEIINSTFDELLAAFTVESSWYKAKIDFNISKDRIDGFKEELTVIIGKKSGEVNIINEHGNFDLTFNIDGSNGSVLVQGIISKNMIDEESLTFQLESDFQSLSSFSQSLSNYQEKLNV